MPLRILILFPLLLLLAGLEKASGAEDFSFSSNYPSAAGYFRELRLHPQPESSYSSCNTGTIFSNSNFNGGAFICKIEGSEAEPLGDVWQLQDNSLYPNVRNLSNLKVIIGTSAALFKLTLNDDGSILSQGNIGEDLNLPSAGQGSGTRFVWYQRKAAFRAGGVEHDEWSDGNIGQNSIALGYNNKAASRYSAVLGGENNIVNLSPGADPATILGGKNNTILTRFASYPSYSVIAGGQSNTVWNGYTFAAGMENIAGGINVTQGEHMVIAGHQNRIDGRHNIISGGQRNLNAGFNSTISGGSNNTISSYLCENCTISGGSTNSIDETRNSFLRGNNIIGGKSNLINNAFSSESATIHGGLQNTIYNNAYGTLSGGAHNTLGSTSAASSDSTISGGYQNSIAGSKNSLHSGENNKLMTGSGSNDGYSTIVGGRNNTVSESFITLLPGENNIAEAANSLMFGKNLRTTSGAHHTFIWGMPTSRVTTNTPNNFLIQTGKVGIHKTNPQALLDIVASSLATETYFSITHNTPADRLIVTLFNNQVRVGINNSSPSYPLHFGNGAHVDSAGNFISASSRQRKEDIQSLDLETAQSNLKALRPVTYNFKNTPEQTTAGFIAEEMPSDLAVPGQNGLYELDILAVLIKVTQDHEERLQSQQDELNNLSESVKQLPNRK